MGFGPNIFFNWVLNDSINSSILKMPTLVSMDHHVTYDAISPHVMNIVEISQDAHHHHHVFLKPDFWSLTAMIMMAESTWPSNILYQLFNNCVVINHLACIMRFDVTWCRALDPRNLNNGTKQRQNPLNKDKTLQIHFNFTSETFFFSSNNYHM